MSIKIAFQWVEWAYSHIASKMVAFNLVLPETEIIWLPNFWAVWDSIDKNTIWILPIENSYAGSIHENMYRFLRYDFKIIWEIQFPIRHCLLSKWTQISKIKKVYSHQQALSQCHDFLKSRWIEAISYLDTAWSAKMVSESNDYTIWAIASKEAGEIYGMHRLQEDIQDQDWNTTRFLIVGSKWNTINYPQKANKITVLFRTRNIPASLYKCLWAFATNSINLSKIESMPDLKNPFSYFFWLDFEWNSNQKWVSEAIKELEYFTEEIKMLWEY